MTKEFDKRNMAKSRRVCEDMEAAHVTKWLKLTERERQILAMWPRFEDGECVWLGDKYEDNEGNECFASGVHLDIDGPILVDSEGFHDLYRKGKRVKRPVPKVLDADGVEIKVCDTVWVMPECTETPDEPYRVKGINKYGEVLLDFHFERSTGMKGEYLTHTRPDSWERLEEDAAKEPCDYFGVEHDEDKGCSGCPHLREGRDCTIALQADLIRRAKALAGAEAGR